MSKFEFITTNEAVATYSATGDIFAGLIREVRELSKKKPDAILSAGKVKIINRVLADLKSFLDVEPEGKFLDLLADDDLPQASDAVLVMVQFETVLATFPERYRKYVSWKYDNTGSHEWITPDIVAKYEADLERYHQEYGEEEGEAD